MSAPQTVTASEQASQALYADQLEQLLASDASKGFKTALPSATASVPVPDATLGAHRDPAAKEAATANHVPNEKPNAHHSSLRASVKSQMHNEADESAWHAAPEPSYVLHSGPALKCEFNMGFPALVAQDKGQHNVLHGQITASSTRDRFPVNIIICVDNSGTLSELEVLKMRMAIKTIVRRSTLADTVGVIEYGSSIVVAYEPEVMKEENKIACEYVLDHLSSHPFPAGDSNMANALHRAFSLMDPCTCHIGVVIVLSTSTPTEEDARQTHNVVAEMVGSGLQVLTIGIGSRFNPGLLYSLATQAGGEFHALQTASQLEELTKIIQYKLEHVVIRNCVLGILFHENDGTHNPQPIQKIFCGAHQLREVQRGRMYELHFNYLTFGESHNFLIYFASNAGAVRFSLTGMYKHNFHLKKTTNKPAALFAILNSSDNGNASLIREEEIRFSSVRLLREASWACHEGHLHEVIRLMGVALAWCQKFTHTFGRSQRVMLLSHDFTTVLAHVQKSIVKQEAISLAAYSALIMLEHAHLNEYAPDAKNALIHSFLKEM